MARHVAVLLGALALIAGACSGSEPVASVPLPTPVADATSTPAPTATATPIAQPTATAAPTPTPAATDEELAVIAAWERYVVLATDSRGKNPSAESLQYTTYRVGSSLQRAAEVAQEDRDAGQYLDGSTKSLDPQVEFRDALTAVVEDCVLVDLDIRSRADDRLLETFDEPLAVRARLELTDSGWLIAAQEDGTHTCVR